ncbi:MAG: LapA family protein [Candidatus Rokuibacteriota bacterium]
MIVVYLLMALLGSVATIFAFQNLDPPVEIRFLFWSVTGMPLALVILLSLLVGIVFAALSGVVKVLKLQYRIRQLEAQVSQLIAAQAPPPAAPHAPQGPSLPA